ncbi:MAG: SpoVG family protein [Planctomycetaceae bacterium]
MEITEVRIKLMDDNDDRLQAFCSITLDGEFVVRDLKIIEGARGLFVAMPSRKLTSKCVSCANKNEVRARYCSGCGARLPPERVADNRSRIFTDIAHPINAACREKIQAAVVRALEEERIKAQQDDYVCNYDDYDDAMARD